jgi:hypothetical protein
LGDGRALQDVLNAVYHGAVQECEGREHAGHTIGNGHHMAQTIVKNVEDELLRRGLFVKEHDTSPHEERAQKFLAEVHKIFVETIKMSTEADAAVFKRVVYGLTSTLRDLFRDGAYAAREELKATLRERFGALLNGL